MRRGVPRLTRHQLASIAADIRITASATVNQALLLLVLEGEQRRGVRA
ncbi:hypothetical protein ABZ907_33720 [Nonomuraea wenchangensis]